MLADKPMMCWAIEASLKSKYVNRTFVSTEDPEIKKIALEYGAEVHDRPEKYAIDTGIELIGGFQNFREMIWKDGFKYCYCVFLYPTFPLITSRHIDEAYALLIKNQSCQVTSVSKTRYNSNRLLKRIDKDGLIEQAYRWDIREFVENPYGGDVYKHESLLSIAPLIETSWDTGRNGTLAYIVKEEDCIDIDTMFNFKVAEMLLKERIEKEKQAKP
jgi:CMP-N,N'-diacetyllegionaminic acid synthase